MASTDENKLEKQKQNGKLIAFGKEAVASKEAVVSKEALAKQDGHQKPKYQITEAEQIRLLNMQTRLLKRQLDDLRGQEPDPPGMMQMFHNVGAAIKWKWNAANSD
jgi:hypothetical protein